MRIVDDALPDREFQQLQSQILHEDFGWYYARRTYDGEELPNPYLYGWVHAVVPPRSYQSPLLETFPEMFRVMMNRLGEPNTKMLRTRVIMNTTAPSPWLNGPHTDYRVPHQTALLYMNDADGDTVIYREQWSRDHSRDPSELTVWETITPKANRLVIFDGLHLHTGTLPTKINRRVVINVNYLG
jgi:hypothetical protein